MRLYFVINKNSRRNCPKSNQQLKLADDTETEVSASPNQYTHTTYCGELVMMLSLVQTGYSVLCN